MVSLSAFVLLMLCALLGAFRAYRIGAPLRSIAPDEAFAELIEQHRSRLAILVIGLGLIPALALPLLHNIKQLTSSHQAAFALFIVLDFFLIAFAVAIGDFPTRKILFDDSRNVLAFVQFTTRMVVAFLGFWLTLFFAPMILHQAGAGIGAWATAGALAALLLFWSQNYRVIFCRLLKARPLDDPKLVKRFDSILEKSNAVRPDVFECGPWNGGWCNAIALPAVGTPRVAMSHSLLRLLDKEEAAAIFAHEVAHLEDFNSQTMRKMRRWEILLVLTGCFLEPSLLTFSPALAPWGFWIWMPLVAGLLLWRVKDMQHRETASDLRAVDLTGNAEAMISALVKVYDASRIPRRMAADVERRSSHPSLARRIQDIREYAGTLTDSSESDSAAVADPVSKEASPPNEPATGEGWVTGLVSSKKPQEVMLLDNQRVTWLTLPKDAVDRIPEPGSWTSSQSNELKRAAQSEHSVTYGGLTELRLVMKGSDGFVRAVEPAGTNAPKRTQFPIPPDSIGAVRQVLDRVDTRLAPLEAIPIDAHRTLRLICFATAILALFASIQGVVTSGTVLWLLVVSIPALTFARRPWVAAFGAMALWGALSKIILSWDHTWWSSSSWILITLIMLSGAYLLRCALPAATKGPGPSSLEDGSPTAAACSLGALAALIAFAQLFGVKEGEILVQLYAFGQNSAASFLPLVGAGAALLAGRRISTKVLGFLVVVAGLSHSWLGSQHFLENYSADPLVPEVAPFARTDVSFHQLREIVLEGAHRGLELSPSGQRFFTEPDDAQTYSLENGAYLPAKVFRISDWDGNAIEIKALTLHFLDDDTLLSLAAVGEEKVEIRKLSATNPEKVLWRRSLPGIKPEDDLSLVCKGNKWRISSNPGEGITARLGGLIGTDLYEMHTWSHHTSGEHWRYVGAGERCLEVVWGGAQRGAPASVERLAWIFQRYWQQNEMHWLTDLGAERPGRSVLWVDAQEPSFGESELMLFLYGPARGWVCSADTTTGKIVPLAEVQPHYESHWDGKHLALLHRNELLLADPKTLNAFHIPLPQKADWNTQLAVAESTVALGWSDGETSRFVLLNVPDKRVASNEQPPRSSIPASHSTADRGNAPARADRRH